MIIDRGKNSLNRRLDADDQIVIPHILDQMYFIEGALDNPLRRHTVIFFHKIFCMFLPQIFFVFVKSEKMSAINF